MTPIMNADNLRNFAYTNEHLLKNAPRGIVADFFGLGCTSMFSDDSDFARRCAEKDVLYVFPYNNPWNWMNPQAIAYTDELLSVLAEKYHLPENYPLVTCGGSMGGHSSLTYTRYAAHTPVLCAANCPVCDLPYHYTERPDLPRTLYSAYCHEDGNIEDVLARFSPYHLAADNAMPDIRYVIFHCTADKAVNKEKHSDRFVAAMRENGRNVDYIPVPDRGHCDLTPEYWEQYFNTILGVF